MFPRRRLGRLSGLRLLRHREQDAHKLLTVFVGNLEDEAVRADGDVGGRHRTIERGTRLTPPRHNTRLPSRKAVADIFGRVVCS